MRGYDDLLRLLDEGAALVFPTEESARAFSSDYVLRTGKGLLASSCMAFDRFAARFYREAEGTREADDAARYMFSCYASRALSGRLGYFAPESYPEMQNRLPSFFRSILPLLDEAAALPKKSREAMADIALLRHEYGAYLSSCGLSEKAFLFPSVPERLERRCVLVMPSVFPKEKRIAAALADHPDVIIADDVSAPIPLLSAFTSEKEEIRALFLEIRKLLDGGETMDNIAVSVPALDRLRPYLDEEAYLFGIPLDYASGISPLASSPGRFLSGLADIHSSGYSLDALKAFMLTSSIPFRDSRALRRFIALSVSYSITSASDRKNDRYMRLPPGSGVEYYRVLRLTLDRLMTEKDPGKITGYLHTISSSLLADGEFTGNSGDAAVYSFALDSLSSFLAAASEAEAAGYAPGKPLFPAFIEYLRDQKYVPPARTEGVRVYPFTQDAAVPYRHRFIIGLNEGESGKVVKEAAFLSDYELALPREERQITLPLLSLYAAMTEDFYISASYDTYGGAALPLAALLQKSVKGSAADHDPWEAESARKKVPAILPLQREGYLRAVEASLKERRAEDDMTEGQRGVGRNLPVRLSYTSFNAYTRCPYLHALQYSFGFRNLPAYEPVEMDHLEIGSRLHSILEEYFREGCTSPEDDIPRIFEEEMRLWSEGMRRGENGTAVDMPSSASRPEAFLIGYLRKKYLRRLVETVKRMDEISVPVPDGLEKSFSASFPDSGFMLDGRVDRIAEARDGSGLVLYDYKKGRKFRPDALKEKSWQFHIYRLLLDSAGEEHVGDAYFVSLLDGAFTHSSPAPDMEEMKERLSSASHSIAEGDWHASSSEENCSGCAFKGICRRRFSVR